MMIQQMGRVVKLEYRDMQPKMATDTSAFVVHMRGPDGEMHEHPLENPEWMVHNTALQFMAVNGFKPSDIDGTSMKVAGSQSESAMNDSSQGESREVEDWQFLVPLVADGHGGYLLAEAALSGGESALKDAEWFGAADDSDDDSDPHSGPHGGGGPDPSTGNRGGVDEPSGGEEDTGVTAELTPEKDAGIEVKVE
jgi:hypothetical protein